MHLTERIIPAPYYAQFEDIERIEDYLHGGIALEDDPYWARSGAGSPSEYAYWANRACGMVCVKTCIEAFDGPILPLHIWIQRGLAQNAYLTEQRGKDTLVEKGWLHAGLAEVMASQGLEARVRAATINEIAMAVQSGKLAIASVSFEIGTRQPITQQGGHLVTVVGVRWRGKAVRSLVIHNPSGRTKTLREYAVIPVKRFKEAFSGRVILVGSLHREQTQRNPG